MTEKERNQSAPDRVPLSQFVADGQPRESGPDRIPLDQFQSDEERFGGVVGGLKAAGLAAARGVTLGATDVALTKSKLITPEELKGYEEEFPVLSPVAEYGTAAASLLLPSSPASKITQAANLAKAGVTAGLKTSPLAAKIIGGTVAGAIEGGLYSGISETLNEYALGDPTLNAQKIAGHFGHGALVGGAIGGVFGLGSAALSKRAQMKQAIKESMAQEGIPPVTPGVSTKTMETVADGLEESKKLKFFDSLAQKKKNTPEIEAAAKELDAPVFEGMISDSPHIQRIEGTLLKSPEATAILRQTEYQEGYNIARDAVENSLKGKSGQTMTELADRVKSDLTAKFEQKIEPINEAYDALRNYSGQFQIGERSRKAISRNIKKLVDREGLIQGTPESNFVESMAKGFLNIDSLNKLQKFRTAMGRSATKETEYVAGLVRDKLDDLEINITKRVAKGFQDPGARDAAMKTINDRALAKQAYKGFRNEMETFGKTFFGKKRIYGAKDFLNKIDEMKPSEFGRKLFNKDNVKFANWFTKNFPEEATLLREFKKQEIYDLAAKSGEFNPTRALTEIEKLQPELKQVLFDPQELSKLKASKVYIDAMRKVRNFNPSDTGTHLRYAEAIDQAEGVTTSLLEGKPLQALGHVMNISDKKRKLQLQLIKSFGPNASETTRGLYGINKVLERATKTMKKKVKAALEPVSRARGVAVQAIADRTGPDDYQKIKKDVATMNDSPMYAMDKLNKATEKVYPSAPRIAQGIQQSLIMANQFLAQKIPKAAQTSPFEEPYEPSKTELSKFDRYKTIVEDPFHALEQVRQGTLVPETLETLQSVYPALYADMQKTMLEEISSLAAKKKVIPYQTKQSVSMFLGQPLDSSMNQANIMANQGAFGLAQINAQMPQMQQTKPSKTGMGKVTLADRTGLRRPFDD